MRAPPLLYNRDIFINISENLEDLHAIEALYCLVITFRLSLGLS